MRDVALVDGTYHSIRVIQSRHVQMDGLYIHNRVNGNNDGFHFISAEYVTVSNCTILSQDDACAMFGSCKFITITNSVFSTRWSVFRFGGGEPPQLPETTLTSDPRPGEGHSCITLNCIGDATMENISFDNIHLTFGGGGTAEDAARRDLPKVAGEYFMLGAMPAYGFYARNSRGLTLQNIRFQVSTPDMWPAVIFDHVEDVAMNSLSVQANPAAESALRCIDSKQILLTAPRLLSSAGVFLQVEGAENENIKIDGGDLSKAATVFAYKNGATKKAVQQRD